LENCQVSLAKTKAVLRSHNLSHALIQKKGGEKRTKFLFKCRECHRSFLFGSKKEIRLHLKAHRAEPSMAEKSDIRASQSQTIIEQVYSVLKKEPSLKPFYICKVLRLNYQAHGDYISHVRTKWKSDMKFGLPSKPSSSHDVKADCYAPKVADRSKAVSVGWIQSKNRNGMLIWKDPLERA